MPFSFFFEFPSFPVITKQAVDRGEIPDDAATFCDILRAVYFKSNVMRKERDAWFFFAGDGLMLRFDGTTMRYLGPDERSMLMLLLKVLEASGTATGSAASDQPWRESTPGLSWCLEASIEGGIERFASEHPRARCVRPEFVATTQPSDIVLRIPAELRTPEGLDEFGFLFAGESGSREVISIPVRYVSDSTAFKILILNLIEDNFPATQPCKQT
jgi:hypothetical protein